METTIIVIASLVCIIVGVLFMMALAVWTKRDLVFREESMAKAVDHLPSCIVRRNEDGSWYFDCDSKCPIDIRYRAKQAQFGHP